MPSDEQRTISALFASEVKDVLAAFNPKVKAIA
jgi:hypothetical protein